MTSYTLHVGDDEALGDSARTVRRTVFIEEQGVSEAEEMDDKDGEATHLVLADQDEPVATARYRLVDDETVKIERVAVLASHRGTGLGARIMEAAESAASEDGATEAVLHGQRRVEGFYAELGYESVGDEFEEAGIPHVEMRKDLT
ncbi:GNAT family N-acetyltransferase [Halomicroarcula sp. GCM10025709]|uniref:GNAT family N-acetyltransferase n=1 Tax=Haloarcula TaxID=2237 RepID=UPI0024C25320|nr:GNAT family N-acetyltransferase [Halomicroarcula sp. YJ-61-S]